MASLALAGGGCASQEPFEIPLLYEHEPQPHELDDTIPILFTGWDWLPDKDEMRVHVLWPLARWKREGREKQLSLLGAPIYRDRIDHRGFRDLDVIAGPVLYGHSADEGSYLAVLPLGGTLRGLLGKDYVLTVLPPAFFYTEDKDFRSTHVLFPFFNWWSGGGRSGGRVFPLFAHYRRVDRDGRLAYRRTWVLWPFWQTLENNLNSPAGAQRMWLLFPLYGRGEGPDTSSWTVLFPFFKYSENRGSGFGGPLWDLRAPWPFVHIVRGRQREITDFWPFYGVKRRTVDLVFGVGDDDYFRRFILWPIWHDEVHRSGDISNERWWLAPVLWEFSAHNPVDGWRERELKVWPIFRYKRWRDGSKAINILSPLWFKDPEGAFERIYGPITRIYHEWRDNEGARRLEVAWGLFGRRVYDTVAGDEVARTSLLFGLFQHERRGERHALRFFFLPEFPSWGEAVAPRGPAPSPLGPGLGGQRTPG